MHEYPIINGVDPQTIFATGVPRDTHDEGLEFEGVKDHETHQMRAIYRWQDLTVNIFPEFTEMDDEWTPVWSIEVDDGDGFATYGPFDTAKAAVTRAERALDELNQ